MSLDRLTVLRSIEDEERRGIALLANRTNRNSGAGVPRQRILRNPSVYDNRRAPAALALERIIGG